MLPVGCDFFLAHTWALEGARKALAQYRAATLVLPSIPYGVSTEHMDFPGTISLNLRTYLCLLQDIVREVVRAGFTKIVCASGHGGNMVPAQAALRDLKLQLKREGGKRVRLYLADNHNCFIGMDKLNEEIPQQYHFHASACETSYYLFHRPALVKRAGLVKPRLKRKSMPLGSWWTTDITATGASGNPEKANAEYGQRQYESIANDLASFLHRVKKDS